MRASHDPIARHTQISSSENGRSFSALGIFSSHDNVVFPKLTSALAARGGEDVEVAHFGHFGILFSHTVARHIAAFLGPSPDGAAKTTTRVLEGAPATNETASPATPPLDTDATKEAEAGDVEEASSNERADG